MIEYTVYETTTCDPSKALKVRRPVAFYDDYTKMVDDWFPDLCAGTHVYMKTQEDS